MEIDTASLEEALVILGQLLADRGCAYEIVAIGGGSMLLLEYVERTTKDLDLVALVKEGTLVSAEPLPAALLEAAEQVGRVLRLNEGWINVGPASLFTMGLPAGFANRLHTRHYKGLIVHLADRIDQICFKLYASVDQGPESKHFADLLVLNPSKEELVNAKNWCLTQDISEPFERQINEVLEKFNA